MTLFRFGRAVALGMLLLIAIPLFAAQPYLVRDVNLSVQGSSSEPAWLATIGNITYFAARTSANGVQLWRTDGTAAGTTVIALPSGARVDPRYRAASVGGRLLFDASDPQHGLELWSTDGTEAGTVLLADLWPGSASSVPYLGLTSGNRHYFYGNTPEAGMEIWVTDGTPNGTRLVRDLKPGPATSNPRILGFIGGKLMFGANDGTTTGIFSTDGTTDGTKLVASTPDLPVGGYETSKGLLVMVDSPVFYSWSLMRTDGTAAGTVMLHPDFDVPLFTFDERLMKTMPDGTVLFTAADEAHGLEIWRTDGTAAGTVLFDDVIPGPADSLFSIFTLAGGKLFFADQADGVFGPADLYVSDGTLAGTKLLKSMAFAREGVPYGTSLYFAAEDDEHGRELWKSDGTAAGTQLVADTVPGDAGLVMNLTARPDGILFSATGPAGTEPWISDGTAAGTHMLRNINPDVPNGSSPRNLAALPDGRLVYAADGGEGSGLWVTDGTAGGTVQISPLLAIPSLSPPVVSGGLYYFLAGDTSPFDLWRSDGTPAGTFRIAQRVNTGPLPVRNGVVFTTSPPAGTSTLYVTDGTVGGSKPIAGVPQIYNGGAAAGGYAYYQVVGNGLWRTDGTAAGSRQVSSTFESGYSSMFQVVGDWLFIGQDRGGVFVLLKMNLLTLELTEITRITGMRVMPRALWNVGGTLVFMSSTNAAAVSNLGSIWRSDGTAAGTVEAAQNVPLPRCFLASDYTVGGGALFWSVINGNALELWRTDGRAGGTLRLATMPFTGFVQALQDCLSHSVLYDDGLVYFLGYDARFGVEPWVSDGTPGGTRMLADINVGANAHSDPASFVRAGNEIYFGATDALSGNELWAVDAPCRSCPRRRAAQH